MTTKFKVRDHVRWNSEAGPVSGRIAKVLKKDTDYKAYTHHASEDDPAVRDQERQSRPCRDAQGHGATQDRVSDVDTS